MEGSRRSIVKTVNVDSSGILKHMGLVGSSGLRTGSLVPRSATPQSDEQLFREFQDAGRVADADLWTRYNTVMRRPTTFAQMMQLWDEMSMWDLMAAALVEIVDEATQADASVPGTVWYQCNDKHFEEDLNEMLVKVGSEDIIQSQVWYTASLGNHFEKIEYAPQEGVMGLSFCHPMDIRRYWLERNRKCIGFRWAGHKPNKEDAFVMPDNKTPVQRVGINTGRDVEDLWFPWDFLHFRRMYRLRISEHGEPVFAEAEGIYKKLKMAVDQMVVHRAQVQPDRYAINIDVQEQPPIEQMKTVQRWKQQLRAKLSFGNQGAQDALNTPTEFNSFYNALALDTVLYLAQPKGFTHAINKIAGTTQVPDVYDIELLTDLFFSIIGMPRSWLGSKKDGQDSPSGKALLAQDIRFLRKIKSIRKPIVAGYQWLGYLHALLKGKHDLKQLDIKAMMPPIGSLEDQMKMEMLKGQAEVLDILADVMEKYKLPKEAWVETVFKRYMHLPDEVVNVFMTALPEESPGMEESKKKSAPSQTKLMEEIRERLGQTAEGVRLTSQLNEIVQSEDPARIKRITRKWTNEDVTQLPKLKDNDIIVSSFGKNPLLKPGPLTEDQKKVEKKVLVTYISESKKGFAEDDTGKPAPVSESAPALTPTNGVPKREPAYRRWFNR